MNNMQSIGVQIKKLFLPLLALGMILPNKILAAGGQVGTGLSRIQSEFGISSAFSSAQDVPTLIAAIIRILLLIGGAVAVLFIIFGGYMYITSGGNEEQAEKGKNTLTNAIIGVVIILLAWVIVNVVVNQVTR